MLFLSMKNLEFSFSWFSLAYQGYDVIPERNSFEIYARIFFFHRFFGPLETNENNYNTLTVHMISLIPNQNTICFFRPRFSCS